MKALILTGLYWAALINFAVWLAAYKHSWLSNPLGVTNVLIVVGVLTLVGFALIIIWVADEL